MGNSFWLGGGQLGGGQALPLGSEVWGCGPLWEAEDHFGSFPLKNAHATQFGTPVGGLQSPEHTLEPRVPACVQGTCVHGVVCVRENVCVSVTGSVHVTGRVWGTGEM